ncbi:putative defensin-like protein 165 [Nymphaea thermarum]|nr:putative defensin-like protein 165 [Nymphaea thermarum]
MKNLRALAIVLFSLLAFSFVGKMVPGAEAGRCLEVLSPDSCDLSSCKQQCLEKYNGNGVCEPNEGGDKYRCACFYNC